MDKMMAWKTAIVAAFTALGAFLGWKGIMAVAWLATMLLDYISGTIAACKEGTWCSATARAGLAHKGGMVLVVAVACIADLILWTASTEIHLGFEWPVLIFPLVLAWYIVTELGSILENAVKMGAVVPAWLTKLLKVSLKTIDNAGDGIVPDNTEE